MDNARQYIWSKHISRTGFNTRLVESPWATHLASLGLCFLSIKLYIRLFKTCITFKLKDFSDNVGLVLLLSLGYTLEVYMI